PARFPGPSGRSPGAGTACRRSWPRRSGSALPVSPRLPLAACVGLHGIHDLRVARTPAQVPGERRPDLLARRIRMFANELERGHQHPRRAEPALRSAVLEEALLQAVKWSPVAPETLERRDGGA